MLVFEGWTIHNFGTWKDVIGLLKFSCLQYELGVTFIPFYSK